MRYYSILRPIAPGTFPRDCEVIEIVNYDFRCYVKEIERDAWGYIEFADKLTDEDAKQYDLIPAPDAVIQYSLTELMK